jgi:hypothetical protein
LPDSLQLVNNGKLIGTGQARFDGGWRDFSFECSIDPDTGKVKRFAVSVVPNP